MLMLFPRQDAPEINVRVSSPPPLSPPPPLPRALWGLVGYTPGKLDCFEKLLLVLG